MSFAITQAWSISVVNLRAIPYPQRVVILAIFAFLMNLPLGYLRQACRKFSFLWFLYIHLSIPFIILLRIMMGVSYWFIPVSVASAVGGQILGARRRRISRESADG